MFASQLAARGDAIQRQELGVANTADFHMDFFPPDFVQFRPLLTAGWLALRLPVWVEKGGGGGRAARKRACACVG